MASRQLLQQRVSPAAAAAFAMGVALFPSSVLHAEAPEASKSKKPMYDEYGSSNSSLNEIGLRTSHHPKTTSPTPTDRLAVQIGKVRVFFHTYVVTAENKVNDMMDSALHMEQSFTSTIASLAPPAQSGEKLMPGTLYVLVAAMAGSIVARNRNVVLRAAFPLAIGISAGWAVLPVTMRNVSDLLWKYEERFPVIADGHIRTRESIENAWTMARIHTRMAVHSVDDKVSAGREALEGWVSKGK